MALTIHPPLDNKPKAVIIKRYNNRKLYNTSSHTYVTLSDIKKLVKTGNNVKVISNRDKEDITALTLLQVMFEDQKKKVAAGDESAPDIETLTQAVRSM